MIRVAGQQMVLSWISPFKDHPDNLSI